MENQVVKARGRPRKRRREESQSGVMGDKGNAEGGNGNNEKDGGNISGGRRRGRPPKKRLVEVRGLAFVGRYVMKEFEGSGMFVGKVVSYDSGLYRVEYEDGDFEDLDSGELREFLIGKEGEVFVGNLLERKKVLDEHIVKKLGVKLKGEPAMVSGVKLVAELEKADKGESTPMLNKKDAEHVQHDKVKVEVPRSSELSGNEINASEAVDVDEDDDYDSSSESGEYGQGWELRSETETPAMPPPELPPSSGNIGVPEEYVPHLFSVYGCLRTFSIRLFLSPFTLDDLVGCLNCTVPCTLLDSIHVALLRVLRRHLESVASDGSELASKCLRCIDWGLVDMLTWPVYLVHYLMTMGHLHENEWNGFYMNVLEKNYCTLTVGIKLTVLQILCDDALDNAEIRAEIDTREGAEFGLDSDDFTSLNCEPKKDYPRNCKTYASTDREITKMDGQIVCPLSPKTSAMKINDHTVNVDEDRNSDECCLCGMDGMLLCCDGCPSAYHSRCIGVSKLSIPNGEWFCPECTFSRIGPPITTGTSLRGAEIFGVDSFAQLFLGTCDHLLVLKVSVKPSTFVRYYSCKDIAKIIPVLCSTKHLAASYMGICEAILKYFGLPQTVILPLINSQTSMGFENRDETFVLPTQVQPFGENGSYAVKLENHNTSPGGNFVGNVSGSNIEKLSPSVPMETDLVIMEGISGASTAQNPSNMISKFVEQAEPSFSGQGLTDRSSITENLSCILGNGNNNTAVHHNGGPSLKKCYMQGKGDTDAVGRQIDKKWNNTSLYLGTPFKPYSYINHFVHGDYAASAAANFAVLLSDENQASGVHASDPRKAMSANVTLQAKAFTSVAVRFFWPSTEKKLMEVPREKCSWCLNCKASTVTTRKVCLLNSAALNATRAAMKYFSSCKLTKNVDSGLYSISKYILYMEESLRGLILGPFMSEAYRQQWCKKVEEASTCSDMKSYLLELEGNLSTIALSSEWTNLVDNWMDESSVSQNACLTTSTQKRGPGRRRKHLPAAGATSDDSNDKSDICWWRGGKLAKLVFKRASLPSSVLKKAAREGGSRRIPGVYYADDSDVPKRSRQYIWRAATEMARSTSKLALQVRYLDHHIKWCDLARPEQTVLDGKSSESDASAFRNALICDKKVVENKIIYAVAFGNQKHLSSRLMKSIIEKEEAQDGKEKYWFSEIRAPLYLIKEYEEKVKNPLLGSREPVDAPPKGSLPLSKLQRKQVRAFRRNAFRYLTCKSNNVSMCLCTSCPKDVAIDFAATCNACEGYCHKTCAMSSTVLNDVNVTFVTICKQCSDGKVTQNNGSVDSPTSPLALQGLEYQKSTTGTPTVGSKSIRQLQTCATASKSTKPKSKSQQLPSYGTSETPPDKKPSTSGSSITKRKKQLYHWGLIFKKKPTEDGSNFRLNNIICKGDVDNANALGLECEICKKPYNPELIYIRCEACRCWFHADAVELDESKLPNLVGFKCSRCRRMKRPVCPYADPDVKKSGIKKLIIKGPKGESVPAPSMSEVMLEQAESLPSTPISTMENDIYIQVDDSILLSVSEAEQISEPNAEIEWDASSAPAPQKLPVRRVGNSEKDDVFSFNESLFQCSTYVEANSVNLPNADWDVSDGGLKDGTTFDFGDFNFENTEFEPQTYFSYTELLEADELEKLQGVDAPGTFDNWTCENSSNGLFDQCPTIDNITTDHATYVPCSICSQTTPVPDLSCQNCRLKVHNQCSREKFSQGEKIWYCGNCRARC